MNSRFPAALALVALALLACDSATEPPPPGNPVPEIESLSPSAVWLGTYRETITVRGKNFIAGSVGMWTSGSRTTEVVSATELRVTLEGEDMSAVGSGQIRVFNPAPGGGMSNALLVAIEPRARLEVTPAAVALAVGDTVRVRATIYDRWGVPLPPSTTIRVHWIRLDNGTQIETYDAVRDSVRVRAQAVGTHRILARHISGLLADTLVVTISNAPAPTPTHDLVFEGYLTSSPELLLLESALGEVRRLFPEGTVVMDPEPSPDGSLIAFVVANYVDGTADIYVIKPDGSGLTQLTFEEELDDQPSWSPDGNRIAFRSFRTQRAGDIWVMDADGGNPVNLTPDPLPGITDELRPAWSPNGARIAYASNAGGNIDIWTMAADGSDKQRLTTTIHLDTEPAWSPDGTTIVFRRTDDVGSDLVRVAAAGGAAQPIVLTGEQRMPVWSPDGERLVFVHHAGIMERPDIYSARPDGTDLRPVVTDAVANGSLNPAFLRRR